MTVSESMVSRLIKGSLLSATVMDQQRVVKLKPRKKLIAVAAKDEPMKIICSFWNSTPVYLP